MEKGTARGAKKTNLVADAQWSEISSFGRPIIGRTPKFFEYASVERTLRDEHGEQIMKVLRLCVNGPANRLVVFHLKFGPTVSDGDCEK